MLIPILLFMMNAWKLQLLGTVLGVISKPVDNLVSKPVDNLISKLVDNLTVKSEKHNTVH